MRHSKKGGIRKTILRMLCVLAIVLFGIIIDTMPADAEYKFVTQRYFDVSKKFAEHKIYNEGGVEWVRDAIRVKSINSYVFAFDLYLASHYDPDDDQAVRVELYDSNHNLVKSVLVDRRLEYWDGQDDKGNDCCRTMFYLSDKPLNPGTYTFEIYSTRMTDDDKGYKYSITGHKGWLDRVHVTSKTSIPNRQEIKIASFTKGVLLDDVEVESSDYRKIHPDAVKIDAEKGYITAYAMKPGKVRLTFILHNGKIQSKTFKVYTSYISYDAEITNDDAIRNIASLKIYNYSDTPLKVYHQGVIWGKGKEYRYLSRELKRLGDGIIEPYEKKVIKFKVLDMPTKAYPHQINLIYDIRYKGKNVFDNRWYYCKVNEDEESLYRDRNMKWRETYKDWKQSDVDYFGIYELKNF